MNSRRLHSFVRRSVHHLHAYVPGEQPKIKGLIKLNTNENPYPPSPKVLKAVKAAVDGRLRLYPNPTAQPLREKLAKFHRCKPENIIVGNGSDELLALATRAFVEPAERGLPGRSAFAAWQRLRRIRGVSVGAKLLRPGWACSIKSLPPSLAVSSLQRGN